MRKIPLAAAAAGIGMLFLACQKDEPAFKKQSPGQLKEDPHPIQNDVMASWFAQNRIEATQVFMFSPDEGGEIVFTGEHGTRIIIQPELLTDVDGNPIEDMIVVKLLEVTSPAHRLLYNLTTESDEPGGNGGIDVLTSGGSVDLSIETIDGEPITAHDMAVMIEIQADSPEEGMDLWDGAAGLEQLRDNTWHKIENNELEASNYVYRFPWRQWDRCNVDRSVDFNGPTTTLTVDMPSLFDESNAEIFVAFPGQGLDGVLASMDRYDGPGGFWFEHGGLANVGQDLTLIAVGYFGSMLYVAIYNVTVEEDQLIDIPMTEFSIMSESDLTDAINNLF
jgi:hypothetical protein